MCSCFEGPLRGYLGTVTKSCHRQREPEPGSLRMEIRAEQDGLPSPGLGHMLWGQAQGFSLTPIHTAKALGRAGLVPHVFASILELPILFSQIGKTNSRSSGLFAEKSGSVQQKMFAVKLGKPFQPNFHTLEKTSEVRAVT